MTVSVSVHYVKVPIEHKPKDGPHYEKVPLKHHLPDGSWRLPRHIVHCLGCDPATGKFDPHQAGRVVTHLFPTATMIEDGSARPDILIPAATVAALGHGDPELGRRVLEQWHDMVASDAFRSAFDRAVLQHHGLMR
jgi:hypothetical protein